MALTQASLKTRLKAGFAGKAWAPDTAALDDLCNAIAGAVVAEIQAAAVVNPLGLVAPSGGGPVTGTGSIL